LQNDVSKRINLSVPDAVFDDLEFWAKTQGRAIANLSAFLLESALNQAKAEGIFPERKEPSEYLPSSADLSRRKKKAENE